MPRVKGFKGEVPQEQFLTGSLHQPDLRNLQHAEIVEEQVTPQHLDALVSGIPVVETEAHQAIIPTSNFEVYPEKTIENRRSAHGVSFGQFVGWLPTKSKFDSLLKVAIKPFNNPEDALREFTGYRLLGNLAVESFEPVGIFPAKEGSHFISMTKTRKDLVSIDRDEWVVGRRVDSESTAEITERNTRTVQDVSRVLAYVHANGVFHPDGQVKNWAVTPEGNIGIIDTENLQKREIGHGDSSELAWQDINKLVKSLILNSKDSDAKMFGVGMLHGLPLNQLRESIEELIIFPYVEELMRLSVNAPDEVMRRHEHNLFEGIMDHFYNDLAWPQHYLQMQPGETAYVYAGAN